MSNLPNGCTAQEIDNLCAEPGPETLSCATCGNTFHEMDTDAYRTDAGAYYCYSEQGDCWRMHQKLGFHAELRDLILPKLKAVRDDLYLIARTYDQDDADSVAALIAAQDWVEEEAEGRRSTFRVGVTLAHHEYSYLEIELVGLASALESDRRVAEREDAGGWAVALRTQDCVRIGRVRQLLENARSISFGDAPKWNFMAPDWSRMSRMEARIAPKAETVAPVLVAGGAL